MTTYEVGLLGTFGVRVDGRDIRPWRQRRAAELVKLLALADGHHMHREQVMDALWPDLPVDAAGANLRKAVHFARRELGSDRSIVLTGDLVELAPSDEVLVDATLFESAARAAIRSGDEAARVEAAGLWGGELLPEDRYASWADEPRDRLRLLAIDVLKAGSLWEEVLDIDPAHEEAHRALMQLALDEGDRSGAIRQFQRLRERLRTDLGIGPDGASVALYQKALALEGDEPPTAAERAQALLAWGLVHLSTGDLEEAERTAETARSLAVDAGLGREIGEASALRGIIANMRGRWKELFRAEFVESVRRSPELASFVFDAHLCLAEYALSGGAAYDEVVAYAGDLLAVAEDARSIPGRALAELLLGEADLFSDRLDQAEEHLTAAERLHEEAQALSGQALAIQRLAETAIARRQGWRAGRLLRRGLRLAEPNELAPHLVVRMHGGLVEASTDVASALERVEAADAALAGESLCSPCSIGYRLASAGVLARAGRIDAARRRLDEAERVAGLWPGGPWHAAVWEARGVLRQAEGNDEQAAALFREAADRFAESGRPRDTTRCLEAAGASQVSP